MVTSALVPCYAQHKAPLLPQPDPGLRESEVSQNDPPPAIHHSVFVEGKVGESAFQDQTLTQKNLVLVLRCPEVRDLSKNQGRTTSRLLPT